MACRNVPWIELPCELIWETLSALTWARNVGL